MSVLENFKNIPRSSYGATGLKCNFFFFKFATKSLEKKKRGPVAPPTGDRPLSPTPRATDQWAQPTGARGPIAPPAGDRGACHLPPAGDRVGPPYIRPPPSFPPHLTSKNPPKIQKKRGVRRREAAKLCRIPHL